MDRLMHSLSSFLQLQATKRAVVKHYGMVSIFARRMTSIAKAMIAAVKRVYSRSQPRMRHCLKFVGPSHTEMRV